LIVNAATGNLKKVSLELGGKSPNIVFADADLETAIPGSTAAIFFNQGQVCAAGSRLFAHKSIFDKVVDGVAEAATKFQRRPGYRTHNQSGSVGLEGAAQPGLQLSRIWRERGSYCSHRRKESFRQWLFCRAYGAGRCEAANESRS
jgi:acyl-CoA reductase-like NAD-dependent aldehyde dehydrogenase